MVAVAEEGVGFSPSGLVDFEKAVALFKHTEIGSGAWPLCAVYVKPSTDSEMVVDFFYPLFIG